MAKKQSTGSRGGKRPILAELRRDGYSEFSTLVWKRHYSTISRAIPRAIELALTGNTMPGDVVEFSHAEFGFQIATLKLRVGGIDIVIAEDEENRDE